MTYMYRNLIVCLLLVSATVAVYAQIGGHEFVDFDDQVYVYQNPNVTSGLSWENLIWAFGIEGPSWHPLTWLSHQLDCELFGLHPGGHHLMSLGMHLASALLLLFVLEKMTARFWPSALVATLFALHPLHVESVAWAAERRDVLSALLMMLALWAYLAYARHGGPWRYLLVVLCFALGLMAKPMLVTLPFALLLLDVWPLGRLPLAATTSSEEPKPPRCPPQSLGWLVAEKIPLLALSVGCSVLIVLCHAKEIAPLDDYPLSVRLHNAALSYVAYLRKLAWPSDLAVFYPVHSTIDDVQVAGAVLLLAATTAAVLYLRKRLPYLAVGWFWYLGTLVPVIGVVHVGRQAMADRYVYIPSIGIYIMIAWGAADLLRRLPDRREVRWGAALAAGAVLVALAATSWAQVRHWRDSMALFERAREVTAGNPTLYFNLGNAQRAAGNYELALEYYRKAIEMRPDYAAAYNNRSVIHYQLGSYELAIADCTQAIDLQPDSTNAYANRGNAYLHLGQLERAIQDYTTAINLDPRLAETYYNRAGALSKAGQPQRALEDYAQAIRINPGYADAYHNRAILNYRQGLYAQARADAKMVEMLGGKLDPRFVQALGAAGP